MQAFPPPQGLYDGLHEHDACGVAFVATLTGVASHDIVAKAVTALRNLEHRGATGAEPDSGDGAGILLQVPDRFFRAVVDFELPAARSYAVGTAFLPGDDEQVAKTRSRIEEIAAEEGFKVLGWRDVPVDPDLLGATALSVMPTFSQLFVSAANGRVVGMALERMAFCLRKRSERETDVYFPSLSSRTIAYKGCSPPTSSTGSTPTWSTSGSSPRWAWSTRGSPPTPSRAGRSRTRSGSSPTTARSTP